MIVDVEALARHLDHMTEADRMMAAGAVVLLSADVAFRVPPPRPEWPERRHDGGAGAKARTLIAAFRRELALAAEEADDMLPRVTHRYPY
jgi:hypothetical protein